jgi:hypothetical protein
MVRFVSLLVLSGVLITMIQSFTTKGSVNLTPPKEKRLIVDQKKQQRSQITSTSGQPSDIKPQTSNLSDELAGSLKLAKVDKASSHLIVDAIVEANNPMARSFPVDENIYDQQEEMEQPLEALDESDMMHELELAGLNAEQNQIIVDGIAEANLDNR